MGSIWRKAHLWLALVSSVFLLLATLTGAILSCEPIQESMVRTNPAKNVLLADCLDTLKSVYPELLELKQDAPGQYFLSIFPLEEGQASDFFVDPVTGRPTQPTVQESPFYDWVKSLHRSLFFHNTGRAIVGILSFLLVLIAISGIFLVVRKLGWKAWLPSKQVFVKSIEYKRDKHPYYHTLLGRLSLLPILVIGLSGMTLSALRFQIIPPGKNLQTKQEIAGTFETPLAFSEMPALDGVSMSQLKSLVFPFSADPQDYYYIELEDRKYTVHQYTGEAVESTLPSRSEQLRQLAFEWHTGTIGPWWSLVLFATCWSLFYFMYSGARIALHRNHRTKKKGASIEQTEYLIAVGSENGTTYRYAELLFEALLNAKVAVRMEEMNQFGGYPNLKELICITSTYGDGSAPATASKFLNLLKRHELDEKVGFSVVGFGSTQYPKFCQFAKDVQSALNPYLQKTTEPVYIDQGAFGPFQQWLFDWSKVSGVKVAVPEKLPLSKIEQIKFKVKASYISDDGVNEYIQLHLRTRVPLELNSGDLLAIQPKNPQEPQRYYSVGVLSDEEVVVQVRRHEQGLISNQLYALKKGQYFKATPIRSNHFHLPEAVHAVWMVANGTGIGPFLGMMVYNSTNSKKHLLWGIRRPEVHLKAESIIQAATQNQSLSAAHFAYSRLNHGPSYVQELVVQQAEHIIEDLKRGGVLMICGSLTMQRGVFEVLNPILVRHGISCEELVARGIILTDCY